MPKSIARIGQRLLKFEDLSSGDAIRFAVGEPQGRRSSTWRLWGNKKGDVYLAMRSLGSHLKISLHKDRRCHFGFTSDFQSEAMQRFGATSRHWERWELPDERVVRAIQIVVPDTDLETIDIDEKAPMKWVSAPGPGRAQVFSIFVAEPAAAFHWESPEKHGHLLGCMVGPTRSTWLVHHDQELDVSTLKLIEDGRARMYAMAPGPVAMETAISPRMTLWGQTPETSELYFIELSAASFMPSRMGPQPINTLCP